MSAEHHRVFHPRKNSSRHHAVLPCPPVRPSASSPHGGRTLGRHPVAPAAAVVTLWRPLSRLLASLGELVRAPRAARQPDPVRPLSPGRARGRLRRTAEPTAPPSPIAWR